MQIINKINSKKNKQTNKKTNKAKHRWAGNISTIEQGQNRRTDRRTDRCTDRRTDRQTANGWQFIWYIFSCKKVNDRKKKKYRADHIVYNADFLFVICYWEIVIRVNSSKIHATACTVGICWSRDLAK